MQPVWVFERPDGSWCQRGLTPVWQEAIGATERCADDPPVGAYVHLSGRIFERLGLPWSGADVTFEQTDQRGDRRGGIGDCNASVLSHLQDASIDWVKGWCRVATLAARWIRNDHLLGYGRGAWFGSPRSMLYAVGVFFAFAVLERLVTGYSWPKELLVKHKWALWLGANLAVGHYASVELHDLVAHHTLIDLHFLGLWAALPALFVYELLTYEPSSAPCAPLSCGGCTSYTTARNGLTCGRLGGPPV